MEEVMKDEVNALSIRGLEVLVFGSLEGAIQRAQ